MANIKVLQIGGKNKQKELEIPTNVEWIYMKSDQLDFNSGDRFDVVLIEEELDDLELGIIDAYVDAYHLLINDHYKLHYKNHPFASRKCAVYYRETDLKNMVKKFPIHYFSGQEGYAVDLSELHVNMSHKVRVEGKSTLIISGTFENTELVSLKRGFPIKKDEPMEVWIEYKKSKGMKLSVQAFEIQEGSVSNIIKTWNFANEDLKKPLSFTSHVNGSINMIIYASGEGSIQLGDIHIRRSRQGAGAFLVGGKLHKDASRAEFISYFDPGNLKPPLNVYFSGYRTAEGFEGYYMMKSLKHPFLLIGDPRLEGGSFYIGLQDYEDKIQKVIKKTLESCGFTSDQLLLSGLSMGSFGALYYGAKLSPHGIIVGKPLVNLGTMAGNETLFRPGGFPTSFDVLKNNTHALTSEAIQNLNQKFWQVFDQAKFHQTKLVISYMRQDDYDRNAFENLVEHTKEKDVLIYGKGIEGRHNDNTSAIVKWFITQYKYVLKKDFEEGENHV